MDESDAREVARQLRNPEGADGLEIAERLNSTNAEMITTAIQTLGLSDNNTVLELGPGNGQHVSEVLAMAEGLDYVGLEISETMWAEAKARNSTPPPLTSIGFELYDGSVFPFGDEEFDRLFTVNTIYFWEDPAHTLSEVHRVLKPGGRAVVAFVDAPFLAARPFAQYGFTPYDAESITHLVAGSVFQRVEIEHHTDQVLSPEGEPWDRGYLIAVVEK